MAVVLVLPLIAEALPTRGGTRSPSSGQPRPETRSLASTTPPTLFQPWPGFGVMCLFVAIVYAIAWTLLDRRDA